MVHRDGPVSGGRSVQFHTRMSRGPVRGGGWHKASVSDCLPLAAPIGLSPLLILTLCGPERERGGGGGDDTFGVFWSAAGGANWPIATYRPSLGPFPSIGGVAHRPLTPLCPSPPSLAYLSLSTSLSFPLEGVPTEPLDCPCFTALCQVHWEEGNSPRPGASKWAPHGGGDPSPTAAFGPWDVHLRGHFPVREGGGVALRAE